MAMLGAGAAADTTQNALQRGATNGQALVVGGLAGTAEAAFEMIGLENLFKIPTKAGRAVLIKAAISQMGVEGAEEGLAEVANTIADSMVMGDLSNYRLAVETYARQGLSPQQAKLKAAGDIAKNIGLATLGGIAMGGMGGAVAATTGMVQQTVNQARTETQARQFAQAIQTVGIDEKTSLGVIKAYTQAIQMGNLQTAAKTQRAVKAASAKITQINANLNIKKMEVKAGLQSSYNAMQAAIRNGDADAFRVAQEKYLTELPIAQAKNEAVKMQAETDIDAARDTVVEAAEILRTEVVSAIQKQAEQSIMQEKAAPAGEGSQNGPEQRVQGDTQLQIRTRSDGAADPRGREAAPETPTQQGSQSSQAGIRTGGDGFSEGTRSTITWGSAPDAVSNTAIQAHIQRVAAATGKAPSIREVTEIPAETAEILNNIMDVAGTNIPNVYLFESDEDFGDGFTDGNGIYIRTNSKSSPAFVLAHEIAHNMPEIEAAGMQVIENLPEEMLSRYKEYREANISTPDNAEIKRELNADMFGVMMENAFVGSGIKNEAGQFGLPYDVVLRFQSAFENALSSPGTALTEEVEKTISITRDLERAAEYSRTGHEELPGGTQKAVQSTPWEMDFPPVVTSVLWNDEYKNNPDRLAGKRGDYEAAKRLARRYVTRQMAQSIKVKYPDALIVPVVDIETEGANMLPAAFAARIAELAGLTIDQGIDKINKTGHAQKDAIGRLLERAQFTGEVHTGQAYYLIADDFVSLGGTIADLRNYIIQNGGRVAGVTTLGASNEASTILQPSPENIKRLEAIGRNELEGLLRGFGIANKLEDLTNAEAGVICRLADRIAGTQSDILHGIRARFDKGSERANDERRGTTQITAPNSGAVFDSNEVEYSRISIDDGHGLVSYHIPEIKERMQQEPVVREYSASKPEETHIDRRAYNTVGKPGMMAFSFDHPELRPFVKDMAAAFLYDIENGTRGERIFMQSDRGEALGFTGTKRKQTERVTALLEIGMTYAEIEDGLRRIIRGGGQENTTNAKKVEIALDDALTNGYEDIDGRTVSPNYEYMQEKAQIVGTMPNALFDEADLELLQQKETGRDRFYADITVDGKRKRVTGKTRDEVLEGVQAIRGGIYGERYYADFSLNGVQMHLEGDDPQTLKAEILNLKQEHDRRNQSQAVQNLQMATGLFKERKTVFQYYQDGGTNHTVAKLLRSMYLRNGLAQGGALAETELLSTLENVNHWKNRRQWWHSLSSPIRLFEELGRWRNEKQPGARAMNFLEGERLKDTYWGFIMDQGGKANLWMEEHAQKIRVAFDGNQRTSTLAQMVGEGIITPVEASDAIYDSKGMIVQGAHKTFVFGKDGQLAAMSSGGELVLFDKSYYDRLKRARAEIAQLAQTRDPKVSHEDHLKAIRQAEQNAMDKARPVRVKGSIVIENAGKGVRAKANGTMLADIKSGTMPNMEAVTQLADALREFYAEVLTQQNAALAENGYNPITQRKGYFPHMGRQNHGLTDFIGVLRGEAEALPTGISGLTSTFAPGKPWVNHMLERMGNLTEYDAIRGFNKYVQASADLIHYTPAIQRIRQLEKFVREESVGTQNSALASWLHNYGNTLANKKPDMDRGLEDMFGREVYTISDKFTKWFGAASVAGSVSSALSNMIGFLSALPSIEQKHVLPAVRDTIRNGFAALKGEYDGFSDKIPELVRRFGGYETMLTQKEQRVKHQISKVLGFAFDMVDRFSAESAARAKYAELMGKGIEEAEAIRRTNDFLVKVFAERSKGMTPAMFNSKWLKPVMQFQLEALNQMSHFRDIDRENIREQIDALIDANGGVLDDVDWTQPENQIKASTPKSLWKKIFYMLLMSLWGALTRELMGRDQTINPAGIVADAVGSDKPLETVATNLMDQLPFSSVITGGGRVPVAGGLEGLGEAVGKLTTPGEDKGDATLQLMRSMLSFIPGGAQAKKTISGIAANTKGGYYTDSGRLRYPVDESQFWKTAIFGPSAGAPKDYDWRKDTLSVARTEKFKQMTDAGIDPRQAYEFLSSMDGSANAGALTSIATFDADGDNRPDFGNEEMNMTAAILGITMPKGSNVKDQAKEKAEAYIQQKRKEKDLPPEKLQEAESRYDAWLIKLYNMN